MFAVSTRLQWALVLAAAGVLLLVAGVGAILALRGASDSPERAGVSVRQPETRMTQQEMRARFESASQQQPPDPRQEVIATIEEHRAQIEADPDAPETPALFLAMGNLHRRLMNHDEAIWCYQQVLVRYPDWDGRPMAYGLLAACYEEIDDHSNVLRVYMDMMREFPEDSEEHQFARHQLGL